MAMLGRLREALPDDARPTRRLLGDLIEELADLHADERPFSEPIYWAAFTTIGA